MMKNRDTASNPYRVPRQKSPTWIKVSIVLLVFLNLALMGTTVYLVLTMTQCKTSCEEVSKWKYSVGKNNGAFSELITKIEENNELMPQDGAKARIEDNVRNLVGRVDQQSSAVSQLQEELEELRDTCRTSCKSSSNTKIIQAIEQDVTLTTSGTSKLLASEQQTLSKVPQMDYYLKRVDSKLTKHIADAQKVCKEGHFRYGVFCYVVGEAALSQDDSKHWCETDFGPQSNLAIIKDKPTQEFIASNLANLLHSYWIGIERPEPFAAGIKGSKGAAGSPGTNSKKKATSVEPRSYSSSAERRNEFQYLDGTKVQTNVWENWLKSPAYRDDQPIHDCVALTYERASNQWYWAEHSCGSRLGYICQYYILSS